MASLGDGFVVDILGGVGAVVHHQQLDVLQVADEEGLVAGGHHVAGLLVGAIANLSLRISTSILFFRQVETFVRESRCQRTEGMAMVPRKRRRTRLSIPLGFLQLGSTRMNRSLW